MTAPSTSSAARLEVLVEPFRENDPGPHVIGAIEALEAAGLTVDMGPFATTADGDLDQLINAAATLLRASFDAGADALQLRIERTSPNQE
jgi:uncharacterized protein YqgV (UPF0045/DUF77 family)